MQRNILTILFLALGSISALAQDNTTDSYIEVAGSARLLVVPDIITYTVMIEEYNEDRKLVTLDEIERRFLKVVAEAGIAKEKINVSSISSSAFTARRKRKSFARKTYNITFQDQVELLNFTERIENTDVRNQYISNLGHSNIGELRLEVKKMALKAARHKAVELLSVVDSAPGKVLLIREVAPKDFGFSFRENMVMRQKEEDILGQYEIGFKEIEISFEIFARFAIQ